MPSKVKAPAFPCFVARSRRSDYGTEDMRAGVSLDFWVRFRSLAPGQVIVDNRTPAGRGFVVRTVEGGAVEFMMNDGRTENRWTSDPGMLTTSKAHHVAIIVDGGPKIISFVIDGKFCDGGDHRQFGWGRFSPNFRSLEGDAYLRIAEKLNGELLRLRIYNRYLRTSEAIGNFRAGP
jgi:hypothetical protein